MKKLLIAIFSMMLILSLCACGANTTEGSNTPSADSRNQSELPDEELFNEIGGTNSTKDGGYEAFSDARLEFDHYVMEKSSEEEIVMYNQSLVLTPETEVFDYMTPLIYWGETLDDEELAGKEIVLGLLAGEEKSNQSADLQKESDNRYTMTIETKKGEQIVIRVEYNPDIDALRLVAENSGEHALLFEYAKTGDGYAAQFYFNAIVGGTYGAQNKSMCVYKTIFSGKDGSCARFDGVGEPVSLLEGVPDEQAFIDGATHWFTLKDDKFTGELDGTTF
ncbi:hypothetical protein [Intestinimonas butyriciproducens]|uniref:hypothetical protein n=1 Tax=Intestinimonas butyriciproducens TaxID=1297617 RepID=UPI00051B07C0|nr:hypothetical protein [Intestinimonas butyriciproducens]